MLVEVISPQQVFTSKFVEFSHSIGPNVYCEFLVAQKFDMKHPIRLDSRHPSFSPVVLENFYINQCHQGVE